MKAGIEMSLPVNILTNDQKHTSEVIDMAVKRDTGKMLIETKVVPNFEAVRKALKTKTGVEPTAREMTEYIEGRRTNGQFLPIAYQKIVSMALVYETPKTVQAEGDADKPKKWTVACFTGDESAIIRNFWLRYDQIKCGFSSHPIIVTCDRKRGTLPLIVNRSFALVKAIVVKMTEKYGMLPEEILEKGNTDENPGFRFCTPYRHIRTAMKDFLTKDDKWENNRPNYMNTYSLYTTDLSSDFSLSGVEETDIIAVEQMVLDGDWNTLAKKTVEAALNNWKNFAVSRYINDNETFIKEAVAEDYLNDPNLAEYQISTPHSNPFDIVISEFRTETERPVAAGKPAPEERPVKAKVLIRKPTPKKPGTEKSAKTTDPDEKFPPEQKYIEFEEGR